MKHCFWRTAFVGLVFKHCLFAHSVRSKLASPQAALLSFFHFLGKLKTTSVAPPRGTWLGDTTDWKIGKRSERNSPAPSGCGNQARDLSICSPMRNHLSHHPGPEAPTLKHCFWSIALENVPWKKWDFLLRVTDTFIGKPISTKINAFIVFAMQNFIDLQCGRGGTSIGSTSKARA